MLLTKDKYLKLKILIITPRIPYPPFRGDKLKIFNIYKMLARNNQVKILTFIGKSSESGDVEELRKIGVEIETVNLPGKKHCSTYGVHYLR